MLHQEPPPPFANIDSYIMAVGQLDQIRNRYNAHDQLALLPPKGANSCEFAFAECTYPHACSNGVVIEFSIDRSNVGPMFSTPKNPDYP